MAVEEPVAGPWVTITSTETRPGEESLLVLLSTSNYLTVTSATLSITVPVPVPTPVPIGATVPTPVTAGVAFSSYYLARVGWVLRVFLRGVLSYQCSSRVV